MSRPLIQSTYCPVVKPWLPWLPWLNGTAAGRFIGWFWSSSQARGHASHILGRSLIESLRLSQSMKQLETERHSEVIRHVPMSPFLCLQAPSCFLPHLLIKPTLMICPGSVPRTPRTLGQRCARRALLSSRRSSGVNEVSPGSISMRYLSKVSLRAVYVRMLQNRWFSAFYMATPLFRNTHWTCSHICRRTDDQERVIAITQYII